MTVKRDRSYHDLTAGEKVRYDDLRRRAREAGSGTEEGKALDAQADALLGLRVVDTRTPGAWRPGAGIDRSEFDPGRGIAGTSRDMGHQ